MTFRMWLLAAMLFSRPSGASPASEAESDLADDALAVVLGQLGASIDTAGISFPGINEHMPQELWPGLSFGEVSARLSGNDLEPRRFHEPGKTIWEELGDLDRARVEARWANAARPSSRAAVLEGNDAGITLLRESEDNVVAGYLALHVLALRFAAEGGRTAADRGDGLRLAFLYEAGAEAYLRAAFFAAHMVVPFGSPIWPLHAENTRRTHHHFRDTGMYVRNSLGDTWQTFGDEVLESHPPTYRFVLEASAMSLRELFLVFLLRATNEPEALRLVSPTVRDRDLSEAAQGWTPHYRNIVLEHHAILPESEFANRFLVDASAAELRTRIQRWLDPHDAPETYLRSEEAVMPVLRLLPVPVMATLVEQDTTGRFSSYERPQLRDAGYHDPDLTTEERNRLPWKTQFPETANLPRWNNDDVSVLYPGFHPYPPSFLGFRTDLGLATLMGEDGASVGFAAGLGYAWPAGLYDLSLRLGYISGVGDGFVTLGLGPHIENPFPGVRWINAFLIEVGYAHDLQGSWSESGAVLSLSAVTRAWSGFTPVVNMGPALELGGRLYVRKLPILGVFAAVGFQ